MAFLILVLVATAAYAVYVVGLGLYRLFLHPLASFPGPKYAAVSRWHEAYYDVYRQGKFIFWIQRQHELYGPVVRITPDELHFLDADLWETVFSKSGRVDKYDWLSSRFGNDTSVLTTAPHDLHRIRRGALNPFFSRQRIIGLQDAIRQKLDVLVSRVAEYEKLNAPMPIHRAYMAFSEDVIMRYCFGHDYAALSKDGFAPILHDVFVGVTMAGNAALQFPLLPKIMNALPQSWIQSIDSNYKLIFQMQNDFAKQIKAIKQSTEPEEKKRSTVFTDLINGPLPASEKEDRRLQDEAQLVIGAGLATTGWALTVGTFYLLRSPDVLARLRQELDEAIPTDSPSSSLNWADLEKLPYLTGVIKEAVRMSHSTTARNVRRLPTPLQFKDWVIPAYTPISMTIPFLHYDEEIYPDPDSFKPERWLGSPKTENGSPLDRYFIGFGKGTRSCLGLKYVFNLEYLVFLLIDSLAWCELYLVFASIFRHFDLELYETDISDIELAHDYFLPYPKLDSKGVRVFVKARN